MSKKLKSSRAWGYRTSRAPVACPLVGTGLAGGSDSETLTSVPATIRSTIELCTAASVPRGVYARSRVTALGNVIADTPSPLPPTCLAPAWPTSRGETRVCRRSVQHSAIFTNRPHHHHAIQRFVCSAVSLSRGCSCTTSGENAFLCSCR